MSTPLISSVAIYPPLGIARIGNSNEYFLASDLPGIAPNPPGGFKDSEHRIKKQVARFRIYGFDEAGNPLREITADEANIKWRVHAANVKAAWYQFNNALDLPKAGIPSPVRNSDIKGADRQQLIIDPGSVTIEGSNQSGEEYHLNKGRFFGKEVKLGELRTDEKGRLLFFGGDGDAASKDNKPPVTFANNDGYHDDTCDGVVRATVEINGETFEATPAMVAVTPPDFGPGIFGVVTMNDVVQDLFIREMDYPDSAIDPNDLQLYRPEFYRHIYPIFRRLTDTQWVNHGFFVLFGKNSPSDFTAPEMLKKLQDNSAENKAFRERLFNWFRDPDSNEYTPVKIPPFYGDGFGEFVKLAIVDLPITRIQYKRLRHWAEGNFIVSEPVPPIPFEELPVEQQIDSLNQAPFEECLGGPFHPGIEITWPMRVKMMWAAPYRLKVVEEGESTQLDFGPLLSPQIALSEDGPVSKSGPGALTRWLGVPWQTDEASCLSGYNPTTYLPLPSFWAARVPNQVLSADSYNRMQDSNLNIAQRLKHFDYRQDWLRDFGTNYLRKINTMVHEWHELGIIAKVEQNTGNNEEGYLPDEVWKETGRHFTGEDPTIEQVLIAENAEEQPKLLRSAPQRKRTRPTFARDER